MGNAVNMPFQQGFIESNLSLDSRGGRGKTRGEYGDNTATNCGQPPGGS